jgi:ABC-type Mn2+/Zn2+ transport system ATPase subunit
MENIIVNFEYCYGIKKLDYKFNFSNKTFAIYAPNGVMKTSFTKTFHDIAKENSTKDLAFPERETIRDVKYDDTHDLDSETILVIEHYNDDYQSDKISTLLANRRLKNEYDEIHKAIDKAKSEFEKKLKQLAGLSGRGESAEKEIELLFKKDFYKTLLELEEFVNNHESLKYHDIVYRKIFNSDVLKFLNTENFKNDIKEYIERYDELLTESPYLKKDFNFFNVETVTKQLGSNNFFKAGHSVNLYDGTEKKEFDSDTSLKELIEEEKKKVLEDDELKKRFEKIDKKLTNSKLREFRDYLIDNQEILAELADLDKFSLDLWKLYFVSEKELFNTLVSEYKKGEVRIKELVQLASNEQTDWENAIEVFNNRFVHLPFYLKISNKDDVILKGGVPTVEFIFKDGDDEKKYDDKKELLKILSTGEQRALYILNVIFEIEARKKLDQKNLLIIDDIADSFDYKNKYAIIDYLRYISELDNFYMIILTHNFDFFRTIHSRGVAAKRNQCLFAVKSENEITLTQAQYLKNPFIKVFKDHLDDPKKLIASIPFIRNIIEYTKSDEDENYITLTSLLHIKDNTYTLDLAALKSIFIDTIPSLNFPDDHLGKKVIDFIFETADRCLTLPEGINLENKIVLSIAIRLKAEQFMIDKIDDTDFVQAINSTQTWELVKKYEDIYNNEQRALDILKRVQLITPENIHINSFMYEPILDMGDGELRRLYEDVKNINTVLIDQN